MVNTTPLLVLCALGVEWQLAGAIFSPRAGAYDIEIKELDTCPDEGTGQMHFDTKLNNAGNGKYTYNSTFSLQVPVDENLVTSVDVEKWGNGGYKPHYVDFKARNCEDLWKYGGDIISSVFKSAGADVTHCPIPKSTLLLLSRSEEIVTHARITPHQLVEYTARSGGTIPYTAETPKSTQGNYTVNDWELNPKIDNIPMFEYNKYKVIIAFYYKGVKVGCGIVYAEIVPKKSAGQFKIPHSFGI